MARARKIQRFLSQPFFVAEQFTGFTGNYVKLEDTIRGFQEIVDGKYDDLPEQAFYMVGTIDDVIEKAKKAGGVMADRLRFIVLTPERELVDELVREVTAPGAYGQIGVLPNHAALVTALEPGSSPTSRTAARGEDARIGPRFSQEVRDNVVAVPARISRGHVLSRWPSSTSPRRQQETT